MERILHIATAKFETSLTYLPSGWVFGPKIQPCYCYKGHWSPLIIYEHFIMQMVTCSTVVSSRLLRLLLGGLFITLQCSSFKSEYLKLNEHLIFFMMSPLWLGSSLIRRRPVQARQFSDWQKTTGSHAKMGPAELSAPDTTKTGTYNLW